MTTRQCGQSNYRFNKLTAYALYTEHPKGGNKSKVLESTLGYNQFNVSNLIFKVKKGMKINMVKMLSSDGFGQHIAIDIPVTGQNG